MKNILGISEASNLGIHALAYLASKGIGISLSAGQIAEDIGVSESHLSKVLQKLVKTEIISSSRGAKGGFSLQRDPSKLSLLELVEKIDGPLIITDCLLGSPICDNQECMLGDLIREVGNMVHQRLAEVTLKDLAFRVRGKEDGKHSH